MASVKRTFTLDEATSALLDRTAERLDVPRSQVVREAIAEYAERADRLGTRERRRLLAIFDEVVAAIPVRPAASTDAELAELRESRRSGGRDPA